MILLISENLAS